MTRAEFRRLNREEIERAKRYSSAEDTVRNIIRSHMDCSFEDVVLMVDKAVRIQLRHELTDEFLNHMVCLVMGAVAVAIHIECPWMCVRTKKGKAGLLTRILVRANEIMAAEGKRIGPDHDIRPFMKWVEDETGLDMMCSAMASSETIVEGK